MSDKDSFIARWSKKKIEDRQGVGDEAETTVEEAALAKEPAVLSEEGQGALVPDADEGDEEPFPFDESDIEKLKYEDDFTVFLKKNAPDHLKRLALRKLWQSHPVFAVLDGLNDYDEDFTDAALVVEGLQTAYRVGKGHLTDDELEEMTNVEDGEVEDIEDVDEIETTDTEAASDEPGDPASEELAAEAGEDAAEPPDAERT